jgi:hypothetical protein
MKPKAMAKVIGGKRYNTETATLIAHDAFWDGHNFERHGRNTFLYRTAKGAYFALHMTQWQGEFDSIEPLDRDEAVELFEGLQEHEVSWSEAFPGIEIVDA